MSCFNAAGLNINPALQKYNAGRARPIEEQIPKRKRDGYLYYVQKGKEIAVHRWVWEAHYKRPIPQGWQVHHINGDKEDNRPENLKALSHYKHRMVIPLLQRRIRHLEKLLNQKENGH